jgi:hypothetical protein
MNQLPGRAQQLEPDRARGWVAFHPLKKHSARRLDVKLAIEQKLLLALAPAA